METKSPYWVFPTVKRLVSLFYYVVFSALILYSLVSLLKIGHVNVESLLSDPQSANYVSIPVAWEQPDAKTIHSSQEPRIFLKTKKQTGQLQVPIRSTPGIILVILELVGLITATWTFFLLRQIFRSIQTKSPFEADIARRITTMGCLFLGQTLVEVMLKVALWSQTRPYLRQIRLDSQAFPSVDITLDGPWLLGLILLALAQVYRRGIKLQLDNELTV